MTTEHQRVNIFLHSMENQCRFQGSLKASSSELRIFRIRIILSNVPVLLIREKKP
jgi:hypothetical protein